MHKVLVVENNVQYQRLIAQTLIQFDLKFVTTVEDAMIKIKGNAFDCVLVDMNLPERSRTFFLSEVLNGEQFEKTPVLCMGESEDITDRITALDMGVDDFLVCNTN